MASTSFFRSCYAVLAHVDEGAWTKRYSRGCPSNLGLCSSGCCGYDSREHPGRQATPWPPEQQKLSCLAECLNVPPGRLSILGVCLLLWAMAVGTMGHSETSHVTSAQTRRSCDVGWFSSAWHIIQGLEASANWRTYSSQARGH